MRRMFCLAATLLLFTGNLVAQDADEYVQVEAILRARQRMEITLRLIQYDPALVEELSRKDDLTADQLLRQWREGRGELVKLLKTTCRHGQEVSVKDVEEIIYPTSFKVVPGQVGTESFAVEPSDFETREVGTILQIVAESSPLEANTVSLSISMKVVYSPEWQSFGSIRNEAGKETELLPIRKPFFRQCESFISTQVADGSTILLGGGYANETKDKTMFAFLTVKNVQVIDPPGAVP